jgi:hypothetical protein
MRRPLHALLALGSLLMAGARADDQVWSEVKFTTRLGPHFDLVGAGGLRFTDDASRLGRVSLLTGANWHVNDQFTITPAYSYIIREPDGSERRDEHRLALTAALRLPLERCEITFAGAAEYRIRESRTDGWRLRPKLKIKRPFGPAVWKIAGYVADEPFYDVRAGEWTINRLFVGLELKMKRDWVLDLYYAREHDLHGRNPDLDILGISMRFSFDSSAEDSRMDLGSQ